MSNTQISRRRGKKNRKHGRDEKKCELYKLQNRREKNKARKESKHRLKLERRKAKRAI